MNRHSSTDACLRPKHPSHTDRRSWITAVAFVLAVALTGAAAVTAQTCEDRSVTHITTLIDQIRYSCERDDIPYSADVYSLAAIADKDAIPALQKLAAWPTDTGPGAECMGWVNMARIALAKLGDEGYRAKLRMEDNAVIGDDRALTTLIEFLIAHAKDPVKMAQAMKLALESGRLAYQSGRIAKKRYATASSPFEGVISYIPGE